MHISLFFSIFAPILIKHYIQFMSRQIFLPELLSISIKNYTLYPNGLDYTFDFVKGVNLVLGGNGMGKTTFVNIVRYAILGLYKKPFGYTRTYQGNIIEKRQLFPERYFSNRMDDSIKISSSPMVYLSMKIKDAMVELVRDLSAITLTQLRVNGREISATIINQLDYEKLTDEAKTETLPYHYEQIIKKYANLEFDDLIFFVNDILFFGEDHKTILWNDGNAFPDAQNELFNKYFNDPDLDKKRQEAIRKAKYFDSLSRHASEDMRAINKVLKNIKEISSQNEGSENTILNIIEIKAKLGDLDSKLLAIQRERASKEQNLSLLQNEINKISLQLNDIDRQVKIIEEKLNRSVWETLHPSYHIFIKNIHLNHICPMCNQPNDELLYKVINKQNVCFACNTILEESSELDKKLKEQYDTANTYRKSLYQSITTKKTTIQKIENQINSLDTEFSKIELTKRQLQQQVRELEYKNAMLDNTNNSIQPFLDEVKRLTLEKELYQGKRDEQYDIVAAITKEIEDVITKNVHIFSSIFARYAGMFLGVNCELTYIKQAGDMNKRFFPVIDGKIRFYAEEMSESQRFFIDHSFRMSILTFFYQSPTFYIVETPDSSLDLSYEQNAANVFIEFLKKPHTLILTSNLNNSLFVEYLLNSTNVRMAMVDLLDIAKQSRIQNANEQLKSIYYTIKKRLQLC